MNLVYSRDQMAALVQGVKEKSGLLLTNFFGDADKTAHWISNHRLFYKASEEGVLFFRKSETFYHLYFYTYVAEALRYLLAALPGEQFTTDVIGKKVGIANVVDVFTEAGFTVRTQLQRYTRINRSDSDFFQLSAEVTNAALDDADEIGQLFNENFDKLSEQIPTSDDIKALIEEGKVLLVKDETMIKGILVRTFTGQTTVLNNFLVRPAYRGEKIGSKLLKHYIFEAKDTRRMMLWVIHDNTTAIGAYEKHGYVRDDLVDCILINQHGQSN